jgi:hypothetical protein
VTHPGIYRPGTTVGAALGQVTAWLESPSLVLLAEGAGYAERLAAVLGESKVTGPRVHTLGLWRCACTTGCTSSGPPTATCPGSPR